MATINTIAAIFFLPETHHSRDKAKKLNIHPLAPLLKAVKDKDLVERYVAWLLFGIAFASMNAVFALYVSKVFGYSATQAGYIFTAMGLILVFNQMVGLKKIWLKHFKESALEIWFFLLMAFGFLLADIKIFTLFAIGMFVVTIAHSTLRSVITSGVVGIAGGARRGEVLGIMASILSLSMIGGPILAGALFEQNPKFPFIANIFILLAAFFLMKHCASNQKIEEAYEVQVVG
jgi:DHA1 family multidrug resistance protein-like MFS transporter